MKIAVVGLYSLKNIGDNVLCYSTIYLLKQLLPGVEIVEVDANPPIKETRPIAGRYRTYIAKKLLKYHKDRFSYEDHSLYRYWYEKAMWWFKSGRYFEEKIKGCDAVVFSGGGFLKFRTQGLNYYVENIIRIARRQHIPVMMNGMGIEGYDENDIRCRRLKKVINYDCVKVITTRDDIDILNNCYMTNKKTITARVGDPGLWVPEVYDIHRSKEIRNVVAINTIRGKIYRDYGNTLSPERVEEFYCQLLAELDRRGIEWELFSNSMKSDNLMGEAVLARMGYPADKMKYPETNEEYMRYLSSAACTFGARLHACIISFALGVPVCGLIWNEKTRFFSEIIGRRELFFTEEELDISAIADAIEKAMNDSADEEVLQKLRQLTRDYLEQFCEMLKKEKNIG